MDNEEYEDSSGCEDFEDYGPEGYHPVYIGERFNGAYQILQKLGWGHFSTVWLVQSLTKKDEYFALKIQRSKDTHAETAVDELTLLKVLMAHQQDASWKQDLLTRFGLSFEGIDLHRIYRPLLLIDNFVHYGMHGKHYCSVFELMGPNLLDLIQHYEYKDLQMPLWLVKRITVDVLVGLIYLHEHCKMIHTDIKPENIMLKLPEGSQEKLVESINGYKKKPVSMKYLAKLQSKNSEKNKKKYEKKKLKKKAAKEAFKVDEDEAESNQETPASICVLGQMQEMSSPTVEAKEDQPRMMEESPPPLLTNGLNKEEQNKVQSESSQDSYIRSQKNNKEEANKVYSSQQRETLEWKKLRIKIDDRLHFKIADFGNATMTGHHFTEEIQTREYRAPEVIVGMEYRENTDIWSLGCMVYEMMTSTFLFKPKDKSNIGKDEDHLYKMIELLGPLPKAQTTEGTLSRKLFNKKGELMHGNPSSLLSISQLLHEDFEYPLEQAIAAEQFLLPLLEYNPLKRISARQCLHSKWLWC